VSNALPNNEFRKKDKQSYRDTVSEVLTVRGMSDKKNSSWRGRSRSKSKGASNKKIGKDECALCHKKGH
jgi:predicted nucleotidyltransferase